MTLERMASEADVRVLCGDLTDHGLVHEAEMLADALLRVPMPTVAVLGNHDLDAGHQEQIVEILCSAGIHVLVNDPVVIGGVGFAGVKGFGGGFGQYMLQPWGEATIKGFVYEAMDEALLLERQSVELHTESTIVVLHYSPIRQTVEGESPELFPYLGCSRLAEPIDRFPVTAVVHGHSHYGTSRGVMNSGCPVFNCAFPLLARQVDGRPYVSIDV